MYSFYNYVFYFLFSFCLSSTFRAVKVLRFSTLGIVSGISVDVYCTLGGQKGFKEKREFVRKTRFRKI